MTRRAHTPRGRRHRRGARRRAVAAGARRARLHVHRRDSGGSLRAGAFVRPAGHQPRRPSTRAAPAACRRSSTAWPRSGASRWPRSRTRATPGSRNGIVGTQPVARPAPDGGRGVRGQRHRQLRRSCFSWNVAAAARARRPHRPARDELRRPVNGGTGRRLHAHDAGAAACAGSWSTGSSARSSAPASRRRRAPLQILHSTRMTGTSFLQGDGRAHSLSASGGPAARGQLRATEPRVHFRIPVLHGSEFERPAEDTPSEDLRLVWEDSLSQDRHGVRFQVGFAF